VLNSLSNMPWRRVGDGGTAPPFSTSALDRTGHLHAPAALYPGKIGKSPGTNWIGGWEGHSWYGCCGVQTKLDPAENQTPAVHSVAHRYTDWATRFPHFFKIHININLPPIPRSSKWFLPSTFMDRNFVLIPLNLPTCPANLIVRNFML
jgi:hypothetical protein